jgi:cytochrome c5
MANLGMRKWIVVLAIGYASQVLAITADMSEQAIARRLQPVGGVYVGNSEEVSILDGQIRIAKTTHHEAPQHQNGKQIYDNYCYICHQEGVAGAPKFGNKLAWQPRIKKGVATLIKHALEGFHYMPPRGTCLECSDDEIKAAVIYMQKHSV